MQRLIELLGLLQAGKGHSVKSLAEICHVSRRTVFRDLELLRQAGVPIEFDEEHRRYQLSGKCFLPPTNFTTNEALTLLILCHELGGKTGVPFYAAARSAAIKLMSSLPEKLRKHLSDITDTVQIQLQPRNPLDDSESVYQQLIEAIGQRRCVRIGYDSLTEWGLISTKLSPYRVLFSRRSWYVIGRSTLHKAVRTFNVGRVTQVEVLEDRYEIPPRFKMEKYLRNAWHLIPEPGPDSEVVIRFRPLVARNVAEVLWHKTQRLHFQEDGSLDFHVTVSGLNEISWWIMGYGDQAEVLRPAALRQLLARRTLAMAMQYNREPAEEATT